MNPSSRRLVPVLLLVFLTGLSHPLAAQKPGKPARSALELQIEVLQKKLEHLPSPRVQARFLLSRARDSAALRRQAAEVLLARHPGKYAQELLRAAAANERSSRDRRIALAALVRRGGGDRTFALRRAVMDRRASVRSYVAEVVRRLGLAKAAVTVLAKDLRGDTDLGRRKRTAAWLAELGDPSAIPHLTVARLALKPPEPKHRPRRSAHVAVIEQQAVVRDFDSEVA